jgi:hypothetical protein
LFVFVFFVFIFVFLRLLCLAPPLKTVTGGTITPVCGSVKNLRTIPILTIYLLRVALLPLLPLRPLRVAFFDLRVFLVFFAPPFKGIVVGAPIPPDQLTQTGLCCTIST